MVYFIIYLIVFSWLITRLRFFINTGLPKNTIIFLFFIKIAAAVIYFQFHSLPAYKDRSDTWKFYNNSLTETKLLKADPVKFITNFFQSNYNDNGGLFSAQNSYWNDVKDASIIKLMAVFNLFTGGNYYTNIIFFNFLFFIGMIAFYRLLKSIYPDKYYSLIIAIFLIPSFLFWCSGIHKDGLLFSAIGLMFFCFHRLLNKVRCIQSIVIIITCLLVIFFLRNYFVMVLLPAMLVGTVISLVPKQKTFILLVSVVAGMALIFSLKHIHPSLDIPQYIAEKQHQFKALEGNSDIDTDLLKPNFKSFIYALPAAIDLGFFRPHPDEKGMMSVFASVEIILFWLIFILCFIYRKKYFSYPPVIITIWIFAFLTLLIIGYTVHFSGAVVRYRSLVMPLILAPMVGVISTRSNIIKKYM